MNLHHLLAAAVLALPAAAQTPDTSRRAPGALVSGLLYDSLARAPLAGALIQLVAADNPARFGQTVFSDSLGRYAVADVPVGRYRLGFFHPVLDSLGVEPPLREVQVDGLAPVHADLGLPSPARLRSAVCGPQTANDAGFVVGMIFDAKDRTAASKVTVTGEWLELSFGAGGVVRRIARRDATSGDNGWFALCNVPSGGAMTLIANRGADSTDRIEVEVPPAGFLRRELYLGAARVVIVGDTTRRTDSLALRAPPRRLHVGDGRLTGTVVTAAGQPLANAQASIVDGPQARANERGEFTLTDAPLGTRMLEVRAVGYYPVRRRVDVVAGAPPVHVSLSTLKSVLDTVKVTARGGGRDTRAFEERRRSGMGRYLTADDIMKRNPTVSSDIFRNVAGVRMMTDESGEQRFFMRGGVQSAGGQNLCEPAIFLNGSFLSEKISASDIDTWVRPSEIAAIEVYNDVGVPAEFQRAMSGCGAIVIWSK